MYRDTSHHGGIYNTFWENWYDMQVKTVQCGLGGTRGPRSRVTGELVCGPETSTDAELAANRWISAPSFWRIHWTTLTAWSARRDWSKVNVPLLSPPIGAGRGCTRAEISKVLCARRHPRKWLEVHGIEHWTHFYTDYGRELQKRFFDYFLKGEKTAGISEPRVRLQIRHLDRFEERAGE